MQSLLLDRTLGQITPLDFSTALVESSYNLLREHTTFPPHCHRKAAVNALAIDTDYTYLLSGCADSSIKLWDVHTKPASELATIPPKSVHSFGVSSIEWWPHDTGLFVSASFDHTVVVWDTNELAPVHTFDLTSRVYQTNMNAKGIIAVASDQPFIRLLDLLSAASAHTLAGHKGKTLSVRWHPQKEHLLASGGFDGEVKLWDVRRSDNCLCRLDAQVTNNMVQPDNLRRASVKAHLAPVNGVVWDEVGGTLFTTGNDDKIRVWDMMTPDFPVNKLVNFGPLTRNKYPQSIALVLSRRNESELQYCLFPSDNGDVFVFRTVDGKMVARLSPGSQRSGGRTTLMVCGGEATYHCGTIDGEIVTWAPVWNEN